MTRGTSAPANATDDALVVCENLQHEYRRGRGSGLLGWLRDGERARASPVLALDGVSLSVDRGEIVGISGPSGSGKSTLIHLLAGLDVPTGGTVRFDGRDVAALSERQRTAHRRDHVGLVFQDFRLLEALSARANVAVPLIERGVGRRARRRRAADLLERVGLGDRLDHTPAQLSGGERQRVAIARALVTDPALLLADEPTGELDSETGRRVLETIAGVGDDRAVVIASHDRTALAVADREIRLRDGTVPPRADPG